jgi:acetolactate synthase I/II/III large subunit
VAGLAAARRNVARPEEKVGDDVMAGTTPPAALTVSELLLHYLEVDGVHHLFGIPGTTLGALLNDLKRRADTFTYHICRHETGAAYIADGYARVTGTLGVVLVSSGPGATNAVTGAAVAQACRSSVLVISAEPPQSTFGRGGFQGGVDSALNINAIYRNTDHYSAVITHPGHFRALFTHALRSALGRPRGAAHISLPQDIVGAALPHDVDVPTSIRNYRAIPAGSNREPAARVIALLAEAKKPLLFLGNGCREALLRPLRPADGPDPTAPTERSARLQRLVEKFALPVVTSANGKGIFPESHPMSLRNYGFGGSDWPAAYMNGQGAAGDGSHYDALLVLGSSLGEKTTNDLSQTLLPDGPLVQVDADPAMLGRGFPLEFGVVADAGAFIDDLIAAGEAVTPPEPAVRQRDELVQRIKRSAWTSPSTALHNELVRSIGELLPRGAHVFGDASLFAAASLRYMTIDPPTEMHHAFKMEPMGWAVAAVVGAAIGAPDAACVAICGDGGFMMHGNEVSTAAQYHVGAVWVVYSNNTLGNVAEHLAQEFGGTGWMDLYRLGEPRLAEVARGLGADAVEVRTVEAFRQAFAASLKDARLKRKPQVVVVVV